MHNNQSKPTPKNLHEKLDYTGHLWQVEKRVATVNVSDMKLPLYLNAFAGDVYVQIAKWAEKDPILQSTTFQETYHMLADMITTNLRHKREAQYPRTRPPEVG